MKPIWKWPLFPYGGDYNPEQWPPEVWREDVELMKRAHVNVATLPVFGWVSLEPEEGRYTFDWLDQVLDLLAEGGIRACMATATASVPAWLPKKYPDVLVVDRTGVRRRHGNRHTFCPNSPNYRRLSQALARRIAERYRDHPAPLLWHVNNEYGTICYCETCEDAFRDWLRSRYLSLDEMNERWVTAFWGHTYTDWSQVEAPTATGESSIQALKLDYFRFQSDALLACFRGEAEVLKEVTPHLPVTTNLMSTQYSLDYYQWGSEMDVVSWDNYPTYNSNPADIAFAHSLMRGVGEGRPFLLMEQSPSQQNWAPYNRLKPPGALRLQSYQAVANGADSVMYFQWRRSRGGIEKLHGAVVEHGGGPENRVFQEVAELGAELKRVGPQLQGARTEARVALLFDWPNWWALSLSSGPSRDLDYPSVVRAFYEAFFGLGVSADVLNPSADLRGYDLIVAPLLTMLRRIDAARIEERVREGATLVASFFSGLVDENDRVYREGAPGPWRDLLGLRVEETDALPPEVTSDIVWNDGHTASCRLLSDRIVLDGAEVLARYADGFYAGEPAVTRSSAGAGTAYYLATMLDGVGLSGFLAGVCSELAIGSPLAEGAAPPPLIEATVRVREDGERRLYLLNHGTQPASVPLPSGTFRDVLSGASCSDVLELERYGVRILVHEAT